ncbi:hypothetical protein [Armatimonas sp.]|uniref:hypothetical protein n=1 Tax=Armatimonas sp. TaxID=1872638 RepID=UPI0037516FD4
MGIFKAMGEGWDDFWAEIDTDRQITLTNREIRLHQSEQSKFEALQNVTEAGVKAATSQRTALARVSEAQLEAERRLMNVQIATETERWNGRTQIAVAQSDLGIIAHAKQAEYIDAQTRLLEAQAEHLFHRGLAGLPPEELTEQLDAYAQQQMHRFVGDSLRRARLTGTVPPPEALQATQSMRRHTIPSLSSARPSDQDIDRIAQQVVVQARSLPSDEMEQFWQELPSQLLTRYPDLVAQEIGERAQEMRSMTITR